LGDSGANWYWRFKNGGRVTANNEAFPSKSNAVRAVKAIVRAVVKDMVYVEGIQFEVKEDVGKKITTIRWS
jgi:uncharacterized protein YegP (UPF0339 family)